MKHANSRVLYYLGTLREGGKLGGGEAEMFRGGGG